jgi:hypothetical protein
LLAVLLLQGAAHSHTGVCKPLVQAERRLCFAAPTWTLQTTQLIECCKASALFMISRKRSFCHCLCALLDYLPLQAAVMHVLVPLLVEVARPAPGTPVTPLLRDMACKLVSAMPTSAAAAAFRTAVTALPAASKQRLQLALKEQQAAAAAGAAPAAAGAGVAAAAAGVAPVAAAAADARKPAIQLKMNFAMPGGSK